MRAIRTAVKGLAPLAAVVATMAVPAVAAAVPGEWTEYDGTPIDTVTADITGNVDIEIIGVGPHSFPARCQVTGEIELSNDGTGGNPAIQQIVSLQAVDSVPGPYVCNGSYFGCPVSQVTYNTPWTGSTTAYYESTFDNFAMSTKWCTSGGFTAPSAGSLSMMPFDVEVGADSCIGGFESNESYVFGGMTAYDTLVTARLEMDFESLEGLSTEEGGPCVKLAAA